MNIGMIHFRVGETDGVSLEMDKWKIILEKMGHKVYYIAGTSGISDTLIIPEMDYRGEEDARINAVCFDDSQGLDDEDIAKKVEEYAGKIERQLVDLIDKYSLNLLIPNNLLSLGRSPHISMALTAACLRTGTKVLGHHHDFYWEREYFENPQSDYVKGLLDKYFPPNALDMKHVVINTPAKADLKSKKGCDSVVVPNVFDFKVPLWKEDDYNSSYKEDMGISYNEVVFLQATRVTNRKAIELAVDLIDLLNTPKYRERLQGQILYNGKVFNGETKLTFAVVGLHEGGDNYEEKLIRYAKEKKINMLVKPELIDHSRHLDEAGKKVYSLWDAYVHCDLITYPSIYEGWGNQLLEGVFAKRPQVVFEYSIFESDIKKYGFDYISLSNTYETGADGLAKISDATLEAAAEEVLSYLTDSKRYKSCVDKNFEIASEHLSMEALEKMLDEIV